MDNNDATAVIAGIARWDDQVDVLAGVIAGMSATCGLSSVYSPDPHIVVDFADIEIEILAGTICVWVYTMYPPTGLTPDQMGGPDWPLSNEWMDGSKLPLSALDPAAPLRDELAKVLPPLVLEARARLGAEMAAAVAGAPEYGYEVDDLSVSFPQWVANRRHTEFDGTKLRGHQALDAEIRATCQGTPEIALLIALRARHSQFVTMPKITKKAMAAATAAAAEAMAEAPAIA